MYGVHTLILKHGLSFDQAAAILCYDLDRFYSKLRQLKANESYIFNLLTKDVRKLDVVITKLYNSSFDVCLRLQVAPLDIIKGRKTEAIFELTNENIKVFLNGLNVLLNQLFDVYPFIKKDYKAWQVNYIEYSANLYSSNVDLAIEMLRKNTKDVKAKSFKNEDGYTLSISRKAKHRRNSSITIYNKEEAVKALHEADYSALKDDVAGYIRFERQLGRAYLWTMIAKKEESNDNLDYFLDNSIAKHVLASGYSSKFAVGDFYSLEYIKKLVESKTLKNYAKSATKSRSIKRTKVKARNGKGLSVSTNNKRIKAFDSMGIAPVAIPIRDKTDVLFNPVPRDWLSDEIIIEKRLNRLSVLSDEEIYKLLDKRSA